MSDEATLDHAFRTMSLEDLWEMPIEIALDDAISVFVALTGEEPYRSPSGGRIEHAGRTFTYTGIDWSSPAQVMSLRDWVQRVLAQFNQRLQELVCKGFDYCAKVKKYGHGVKLTSLVLAAMAPFFVEINTGLPIAAVVVYLVKDRYFDRLCACP